MRYRGSLVGSSIYRRDLDGRVAQGVLALILVSTLVLAAIVALAVRQAEPVAPPAGSAGEALRSAPRAP